MEGKLSTEDDESSTSPTRRRVLKASAALTATGVVGSGFVGSAAGKHEPTTADGGTCTIEQQCNGTVVFGPFQDHPKKGTVGDGDQTPGCDDDVDSIVVDKVVIPCQFEEAGGFVDVHDRTRKTGATAGTFKAGYPVGVSTLLQKGTHHNVPIPLMADPCHPPCLVTDDDEFPSDENPGTCIPVGIMIHQDAESPGTITHYCGHEGPERPDDHAYLCDEGVDGTKPVQVIGTLCGDGPDLVS